MGVSAPFASTNRTKRYKPPPGGRLSPEGVGKARKRFVTAYVEIMMQLLFQRPDWMQFSNLIGDTYAKRQPTIQLGSNGVSICGKSHVARFRGGVEYVRAGAGLRRTHRTESWPSGCIASSCFEHGVLSIRMRRCRTTNAGRRKLGLGSTVSVRCCSLCAGIALTLVFCSSQHNPRCDFPNAPRAVDVHACCRVGCEQTWALMCEQEGFGVRTCTPRVCARARACDSCACHA